MFSEKPDWLLTTHIMDIKYHSFYGKKFREVLEIFALFFNTFQFFPVSLACNRFLIILEKPQKILSTYLILSSNNTITPTILPSRYNHLSPYVTPPPHHPLTTGIHPHPTYIPHHVITNPTQHTSTHSHPTYHQVLRSPHAPPPPQPPPPRRPTYTQLPPTGIPSPVAPR